MLCDSPLWESSALGRSCCLELRTGSDRPPNDSVPEATGIWGPCIRVSEGPWIEEEKCLIDPSVPGATGTKWAPSEMVSEDPRWLADEGFVLSISGPEAPVETQEPVVDLSRKGTNSINLALVPGESSTWAGPANQGCVEAL